MRILDGRTVLSVSNLKRSMGCAQEMPLAFSRRVGSGANLVKDSGGAAFSQEQGNALSVSKEVL